jgi:hypothetical protein
VFLNSLNDALVTAFIIFSLFARDKNKMVFSAIFISIAGLMKLYPFILIPFLALEQGKLNKKFLIASFSTIFLTFFICYLLWGINTLGPIFMSVGRQAGYSVFAIIENSHFSPLRILFPDEKDFLIRRAIVTIISLVLTLGGLIWWYLLVRAKKINWIDSSLFILLWLLTFYKLGFARFFLSFFLIFAYWYQKKERNISHPPYYLILAVLCLLIFFRYGYGIINNLDILSVVLFLLQVTVLCFLYKRIVSDPSQK